MLPVDTVLACPEELHHAPYPAAVQAAVLPYCGRWGGKAGAGCKGLRGRGAHAVQDGGRCRNPVNAARCRYCDYHVQSEYRRLKTTRGPLQSSTVSGRLNAQAQQAGAAVSVCTCAHTLSARYLVSVSPPSAIMRRTSVSPMLHRCECWHGMLPSQHPRSLHLRGCTQSSCNFHLGALPVLVCSPAA